MRHALLILWHKDMPQLTRMLRLFDEDFDCYIHIDRRSVVVPKEMEALKAVRPGLYFYSKYKIRWGGFYIVKAELFLLEKIINSGKKYDYIHFFSGQDYPIKKLSHIKKFFKEHKGQEFIEYMRLPSDKWEQGTFRRFYYYYMNDWIDYRTPCGSKFLDKFVHWQCKLGLKRNIPKQFDYLYGGSNWMSITNECAAYIVRTQKKNKSFYNRLKYTFAPDEVYFHTVILNSPFAAQVKNNNLRCIIWGEGASSPCTLTEKNWWDIATSDRLFTRKMSNQPSATLMEWIDNFILHDENISIASQGYWQTETLTGHYYDSGLAKGLLKLLSLMSVKTIADFGCGPGWYVALLRKSGYEVDGYDGNPFVEKMSARFFNNGFYCQCMDLTEVLETEEAFDMVLSLEVGEHIPVRWEDTYLQNLTRNASQYVILSWAVEGQWGDGHINCRSNAYIIEKMKHLGFIISTPVSNYLRTCASRWWLKHTIMFFERT
ncbi:MAG: beta-1,6-N-acetylglucosaminyltransferase [Bacteroides sp.]|uniref:beta-1,6-N-acetylglucosaminyltransferase n=1 Tax=Bacteroides sp. TaxID=29523 RepID=UPI0026DEB839|nr:beta-1,6-N-acetylglucosaminyltransferase [Bacteroides sp.]MDO5419626.1 beta-1,6-N-acetylglucosaminyltransferase [Bacteroides sp.]